MFGNLKKKFNSALQAGTALTDSIHQQYLQRRSGPSTSLPTSPSTSLSIGDALNNGEDQQEPPLEFNQNMFAGCELLAKYEDDWKAIHEANQSNASIADTIANQIEGIQRSSVSKQREIGELVNCLSEIPAIRKRVEASLEALHEIMRLSSEIDDEVVKLEDLCEECDLQEYKLQKQFELSQYKQKKMRDLETHRQKIVSEHEDRIRKYEDHLRKIQLERQAVFDDVFRGDMEDFKQRGVLPKISAERPPSKALAEVEEEVVDTETRDALEEFLNG